MEGKLIFPGKASKRCDEWYNTEVQYRTIDSNYLKAKVGKQWFTFVTERQWMRENV